MFEGVTILDVVNTGALGMMFWFAMQMFNEIKETRKENNQMWREMWERVTFIERSQGIEPGANENLARIHKDKAQ